MYKWKRTQTSSEWIETDEVRVEFHKKHSSYSVTVMKQGKCLTTTGCGRYNGEYILNALFEAFNGSYRNRLFLNRDKGILLNGRQLAVKILNAEDL